MTSNYARLNVDKQSLKTFEVFSILNTFDILNYDGNGNSNVQNINWEHIIR